ncbi:MAG TPA: hypothetical protein DIU39_07820 [Flavobacteriales bacterium]|nr:hypothetical protein [Flavobacteriales bacterium]|tara:strand:- start:35266 stop:36075 length:810 start_codon:yes stop_codon:yes gene_type:complete
MKINYKFLFAFSALIVASGAFVLNLQSNQVHAFGSGAPTAKTGSPGDGSDCTSCHSGTAQTASNSVTISSDIPVSGYVPGTTYTITVEGVQQNITKFGFEITAEDNANAKAGSWATANNETQVKSSNWVTHTSSGTAGNGFKIWTMNWTAPVAGTGDVTFYAAVNATNANGANSGDLIMLNNITVQEDASASVNNLATSKISVYPNPTADYIYIKSEQIIDNVQIFDISGKNVYAGKSNVVNLKTLPQGTYFVRLEVNNTVSIQKIVKL